MKKNFVPKYNYYTNGKDIVVAKSSYAGDVVRGVAKCSPEDKFDLEAGKKIAAGRCAIKVAKKRVAYWEQTAERYNRVVKYWYEKWEKSKRRRTDAIVTLERAKKDYEQMMLKENF